ncbi:ubiquinone biosynthesis accessory factor UbiJ [Glaciecola sp. 1036]|uniref:ubiquinone biosynthesis accessory factor UbiJ n=1 Tax=Alteromonadaceae TaxID=72275 RepID=UPI003D049C79
MPMHQAITASLETAINSAISLSNNGSVLLTSLAGKNCSIHIQDFTQFPSLLNTFCIHFSADRVDVTAAEPIDEKDLHELDANSCYVSIALNALPELQKTSHLTKLIKQGKLDFYGELSILQAVSKLFSELDIDIPEVLARYIGDVPSQWLVSSSQKFYKDIKRRHERNMATLSDIALEEKPIAVRPIMLTHFADQVKDLQSDVARLEARIARLESEDS